MGLSLSLNVLYWHDLTMYILLKLIWDSYNIKLIIMNIVNGNNNNQRSKQLCMEGSLSLSVSLSLSLSLTLTLSLSI